jgi:hypothetical protein
MITPTIGRIVWYYPKGYPLGDGEKTVNLSEPRAAVIVKVWSDRMVNLGYWDPNGDTGAATSVPLVQPEDAPQNCGVGFCEWMPYQVKKPMGSESGEKSAGEQVI